MEGDLCRGVDLVLAVRQQDAPGRHVGVEGEDADVSVRVAHRRPAARARRRVRR